MWDKEHQIWERNGHYTVVSFCSSPGPSGVVAPQQYFLYSSSLVPFTVFSLLFVPSSSIRHFSSLLKIHYHSRGHLHSPGVQLCPAVCWLDPAGTYCVWHGQASATSQRSCPLAPTASSLPQAPSANPDMSSRLVCVCVYV